MADQVVKEEKAKVETPAETAGRKPKKKKSRPTNCVQSNKRIRRKDWYYRDGKYFANKKAFKLYAEQEAEKAKKAEASVQAVASASAPEAPPA